jgi:hypothetical protein
MSSIDEILADCDGPQASQEAFYKDLHEHPELSHEETHRAARCPPVAGKWLQGPDRHRRHRSGGRADSPKFLPPLEPTLRTGTEALIAAALAWLAPS